MIKIDEIFVFDSIGLLYGYNDAEMNELSASMKK